MLLAIDTATRTLSLALHDEYTLIAEQTWRAGNRHNTLLAPAVKRLFNECDVVIDDLTAVAVAIGPGSYTGLRIGVALAKGIATTANLPLIGMTTLDILASAVPFQNTRYRLLTVVPAGRGRIIVGEHRIRKGRWTLDGAAQITTWEDTLSERTGSYYITGEINETGREFIAEAKERDDLSLTVMSPAYRTRRSGFLAEEAWRLLNQNSAETYDPQLLMPVYLKSPD